MSWYKVFCFNPADYADYGVGVVQNVDPINGDPTNWVTFLYKAFNVNEPVPAPRVSTEELAQAARKEMRIPAPTTERNPKIDAAGAPTLVGLPTWFWVAPAAVGGDHGVRTITAALAGPQPLSATVTAKTDGLQLNSPAGAAHCGPERAAVKYAKNLPDTAGCTLQFTKASVGYAKGYPVTASTSWNAVWTGSDGKGGELDGLTRTVVSLVPVAEVQTVVTH
jgi:hypothetical protein